MLSTEDSMVYICDVIKQNQSEEPNKAENVFSFILFLASFNCSIGQFQWGFLQNVAAKMMHTVS